MHIIITKNAENWEKYRILRNKCAKMTKRVKREYFSNLNITSVTDNKMFWKTVKPFFSEKNTTRPKITIVEKDKVVTNNCEIAGIMNEYFVNITKNLNIPNIVLESTPGNLNSLNVDHIDEIILSYNKHPSIQKIKEMVNSTVSFRFDKTNETHISNEILALNSGKASGPDNIPSKVLKYAMEVIKSPLALLFNNCVDECHFPSDLKYADVTPLFKKGNNTNKENYRPISILPSISKIYERQIFKQISNFVSTILSPYLCGFRKGFNTQHALLRLKSNLNKSLDKKEKVGLFLMDLSKAFDCISHDLLIAKLNAYGFEKSALKLIYSYLKGRKQRVKINIEYSSWADILNGVPQGSVLGPLLFNIFTNDLFYFVENSNIYNFADDNTLSVADANLETVINKLESDINYLDIWFKENGLLLNETKCQFMIAESSNARRDPLKINVHNKEIEEVKKVKLLGITLDNNMSMMDHIRNLCKRAGAKLSALARISPFINEQKRIILMKSFIVSQFNYCPIIWMYCQRRSNNLINKIHERALRIAYNDYVSSFDSLLGKDQSVTFHQRNIQSLCLEIYKTTQNINPSFMKEVFTIKNQTYNTRKQYLLYPNPHTVAYGLNTFGYRGSLIWSSLPKEIQNTNDISEFKEFVSENVNHVCKCNLCKPYIQNIGYIE